jgi:hypothetical protein
MTTRFIYIILIFFAACNLHADRNKGNIISGNKIAFQPTGLSNICSKIIESLTPENHGVFYIDGEGKSVNIDTIKSLVYKVSKLDITNNGKFETYFKSCKNANILIWVSSLTQENSVSRIEKTSFKTEIKLSDSSKNTISISDFDIYFVGNPNHISLRIVYEDELELLMINGKKYIRISESILMGLGLAIEQFDKIKNLCKQ